MLSSITKTFAIKVSWSTWKQIYDIKKIQEFYQQNSGKMLSLEELMKITGCSSKVLEKMVNMIYENYDSYLDDSFEDEIINRIDVENIYSDLEKIPDLSFLNLQTLCMIYGLQDNNCLSISELASREKVSRNAIYLRCGKAFQIIREDDDFVKKYTK